MRIVHSHNTALRKSPTRLAKLVIHNLAKRHYASTGTQLLACSTDAAKFMYPKNVIEKGLFTIVPNGIDTKRFQFCEGKRIQFREKWNLQDRLVVGNIGRLCYQKNQSFLLDVFAALLKLHSESTLLLIGNGEDEQMLREKVERLGITKNVVFWGTTSEPEEVLWAMDVFIFPSLFEGLGIVAIEAQVAGLPTLCSEHIPLEANVTPLLKRMELKETPEKWAETLLKIWGNGQQREKWAEVVKNAGYDISDVARMIEARYNK